MHTDEIEMTGSAKQIAWAQSIRAKMVWEWTRKDSDAPGPTTRSKFDAVRDNADEFAAQVFAHTDASWWIDNTASLYTLVGTAVREHLLALIADGMSKEDAVASIAPVA